MNKILILGAGKMGSWLAESLCLDYDVAIYDKDLKKLKYFFKTKRLVSFYEIHEFAPDLMINAVNLEKTIEVFEQVIPLLPEDCIIADIASVKNGLKEFYSKAGRRFVSTHPMFGPTFGNVKDLSNENAIIIRESDPEGKSFFHTFYESLNLNIFEYSFKQHDKTIAYSLSIPFSSSMVFAACMKKLEVPGTTFKKHLDIAKGLLSEDDYLLSEILFNPYSLEQVENINSRLSHLISLIKDKNGDGIREFLDMLRENIGEK
ncbi:MAG: prephenate dehydrogenase [Bacteroidales bacterium]|nr:MAG: prephenate dehydrogenase [Bacteroidales bacterium]